MTKFFEGESAQENLSKSLLEAARGVDETGNQTVVPVVQEELVVGKRVVETGQGIRVTKTVSEREEIVDELLAKDDVTFERVTIDKIIDAGIFPASATKATRWSYRYSKKSWSSKNARS